MAKPKSCLSHKLREYYETHGVTGVESYIQKSQTQANNRAEEASAQGHPKGSRFIRLNPRYDASETLSQLEQEIKEQYGSGHFPITKVTWLPSILGFYAIPESFSLSQSLAFRTGRIYGMDVSSGAAVATLLFVEDERGFVTKKYSDASELRILDLCCAPGLKTCAIADVLLATRMSTSSIPPPTFNGKFGHVNIVGVDISETRLHLCRNVIRKYHLDHDTRGSIEPVLHGNMTCLQGNVTIQLFHTDGATFGLNKYRERDANSLVFDSNVATELVGSCEKRKRMNKSAKSRERKRLKAVGNGIFCGSHSGHDQGDDDVKSTNDDRDTAVLLPLFDRVLVDAECSTDGALRHLQHKCKESSVRSREGMEENTKLTDASELEKLVELQKKLISSGFRLLKPGGVMVYSTCSLAREQNENVVSWLLEQCGDSAEIVPVLSSVLSLEEEKSATIQGKGGRSETTPGKGSSQTRSNNIMAGDIQGTVRFHPSTNSDCFGGGFFIAKLRKTR